MRFGYWKIQVPGEAMESLLNEAPAQGTRGWSRLTGAAASEYNVAGILGSNQVVYEYKPNRRYTMRCWLYPQSKPAPNAPFPQPVTHCSMRVPYKSFLGERCTQLEIHFKPTTLHDWRVGPTPGEWQQIAELERSVLKPLRWLSDHDKLTVSRCFRGPQAL